MQRGTHWLATYHVPPTLSPLAVQISDESNQQMYILATFLSSWCIILLEMLLPSDLV